MTRFIPPILIGAATGLADASGKVLADQPVNFGTVISVTTIAVSICLWLMAQFKKRDELLESSRELLITRHSDLSERLSRIEQKIEDLPCLDKRKPCDPVQPTKQ